jgi:DNA polymerase-3 subunit delta
MNFAEFRSDSFTVQQVVEAAETVPFFADRRVILLENTDLWTKDKKAEGERLAAYIGTQPETTVIIMSEPSVDKRQKLFLSFRKNGEAFECGELSDRDYRSWVVRRFAAEGKAIRESAFELLLAYAGSDMLNMSSEIAKAVSYVGDRKEVTEEDIRAICSRQLQDRIFDMIAAIGRRDRDGAFSCYMDLVALQTPPQVILSLMERQYGQMLKMKETLQKTPGMSVYDAAAADGVPYGAARQYAPLLPSVSAAVLRAALERCVNADAAYKNGKYTDRLAVEKTIVELTAPVRKR